MPLLVHEEVGGFYVAMKHASGVRKLKQVRAADGQAHARALGQLLFIGIAVDGDAADGGGSDIGGAGVRVARVDLAADARLFEKATFVVETCALLGVARSPQNLDRNRQSIPFTFAYPSAAPPLGSISERAYPEMVSVVDKKDGRTGRRTLWAYAT